MTCYGVKPSGYELLDLPWQVPRNKMHSVAVSLSCMVAVFAVKSISRCQKIYFIMQIRALTDPSRS